MDEDSRSHRTRSKAAPDWTVQESLLLVNEINAVESEWGASLPSFQKWQQIVGNCSTLDVNRNLNQCKRHWEALLSDYYRLKNDPSEQGTFPLELFNAIDRCVQARAKWNGGDGFEAEDMEGEDQLLVESDPESQEPVTKFCFGAGSKSQKRRMQRKKRKLEDRNPWGYFTSTRIKNEECSSVNEDASNTNSSAQENGAETKEQMMATLLLENALQINSILEGQHTDEVDYELTDLGNSETVQTEFIRRQGDRLIDSLSKISETLNQLCDIVQQCN